VELVPLLCPFFRRRISSFNDFTSACKSRMVCFNASYSALGMVTVSMRNIFQQRNWFRFCGKTGKELFLKHIIVSSKMILRVGC
jgi:hypothetical protein